MTEISWGIIGCGDVTEVKSGPALMKAPHSSVAAVMRRDGGRAEDYARRHGVARWFDNVDDLLGCEAVNAVYVATPPSTHLSLAVKALDSGRPVLVEKPMAMNVGECAEMIAAAKANDQPLFVAYYRRALPRFEKMRDLVQSGAIGTPRCVIIRHLMNPVDLLPGWRVDPAVAGGGHFVDKQTHALNWIDHTLGPVAQAMGVVANQSQTSAAEDTVGFTLRLESGLVVSGMCCYVAGEPADSITVVGSEGQVEMSCLEWSPLRLTSKGSVQEFDIADPPHVHQPFIETVVAHIRGEGLAPCMGADGMRTTWVTDQLYADYRGAGGAD
ncbi:MAG: Gfo/Idh/MocA family protein [Alphaproteobacteria bacterium]